MYLPNVMLLRRCSAFFSLSVILMVGCIPTVDVPMTISGAPLPVAELKDASTINCELHLEGIDYKRQFIGEDNRLLEQELSFARTMVLSEKRTIVGQIVASDNSKKIKWYIFYVDKDTLGLITTNQDQYSGLNRNAFIRLLSITAKP